MINGKDTFGFTLTGLFVAVVIACHPAATMPVSKSEKQQVKEIAAGRTINPVEVKPAQSSGPIRISVSGANSLRSIKQQKNPYTDAEITVEVIPSGNKTYGYKIVINGKTFVHLVHQPNIPGMPGNKGFQTEEDARKVAEFVVRKIRNNEVPPTVTNEDLQRMGVLRH